MVYLFKFLYYFLSLVLVISHFPLYVMGYVLGSIIRAFNTGAKKGCEHVEKVIEYLEEKSKLN